METFSRYKGELMGIAILLVLCYHIFTGIGTNVIPCISSIGYFGVDIFLFLSGLGLCHGYGKYNSLFQFYKKRITRIYPTYISVIIVGSILGGSISVLDILIKSLGIGFFFPVFGMSSFDWYVPTIYLLYLCFPIAYSLIFNNIKWG